MPTIKFDKATVAVIASVIAAALGGGNMLGGSEAASQLQRDVSDIRERVVRVETLLESQRRSAALE
jgi:hypothetical protein